VVIAVPVRRHFHLTDAALDAGKHVLCEKPLTLHRNEAEQLLNKAAQKNLTLMCGHVFLYNPGILELERVIRQENCGPIRYLTATRVNLGPFHCDVNVAWDLASHDLYIFSQLLGLYPESVSCHGGRYLGTELEEVCFLNMRYPDGAMGNIHVSWLSPTKIREIVVVCERKMVIWNDLNQEGPIKIYNSRVERRELHDYGMFLLSARASEILIPRVQLAEPLALQNLAFLSYAAAGVSPEGIGADPVAVIAQLEAAEQSMKENGAAQTIHFPTQAKV